MLVCKVAIQYTLFLDLMLKIVSCRNNFLIAIQLTLNIFIIVQTRERQMNVVMVATDRTLSRPQKTSVGLFFL